MNGGEVERPKLVRIHRGKEELKRYKLLSSFYLTHVLNAQPM